MSFDCPAWPPRWPEIEAAIGRALSSGSWGQYHSELCASLEKRLLETFQVAHARLCCSGTAALEIALRVLQLDRGDEVILAAYDYPGNFRTIELLGARPVLVDVASESASIDPEQLEGAASERVRAVIASHLYGQDADVAGLREVCERRGWTLIEDACQVIGMKIAAKRAGSFGDMATLSFGGSKLVSAGSGGALLVQSERFAARLGPLLDRPGEAFPLSPLQAAAIEPQLDRLDEINAVRNATAEFLRREADSQLPRWSWLSGNRDADLQPAFYKLAWLAESVDHRARIIEASRKQGIPIGAGFRSSSRCSERRCRKPMATPRSDRYSETLFVLDHRALLVEPSRHQELLAMLQSIHDSS